MRLRFYIMQQEGPQAQNRTVQSPLAATLCSVPTARLQVRTINSHNDVDVLRQEEDKSRAAARNRIINDTSAAKVLKMKFTQGGFRRIDPSFPFAGRL